MLGQLIGDAAIIVEFGGAMVIAIYGVLALWRLAVERVSVDEAKLVVAQGVLAALSFKLAATLLKTIELQSFTDIGAAVAILGIRTLIKQALLREGAASARRAKAVS